MCVVICNLYEIQNYRNEQRHRWATKEGQSSTKRNFYKRRSNIVLSLINSTFSNTRRQEQQSLRWRSTQSHDKQKDARTVKALHLSPFSSFNFIIVSIGYFIPCYSWINYYKFNFLILKIFFFIFNNKFIDKYQR